MKYNDGTIYDVSVPGWKYFIGIIDRVYTVIQEHYRSK